MIKGRPPTKLVNNTGIDKNYLFAVADYMVERQKIYYGKLGVIDYKTSDQRFQKYRFCNVYREFDKFTKGELLRLSKAKSLKEKLRIILIGRHSVMWSTADLVLSGKFEKLKQRFDDHCGNVGKLKTSDPFISSFVQMYVPHHGSTHGVIVEHAEHVEKFLPRLVYLIRKKVLPVVIEHELLISCPLLKKFRVYEVLTSLCYLDEYQWTEDDYFLIGPGSLKPFLEIGARSLFEIQEELFKILITRKDFLWPSTEEQANKNIKYANKLTLRTTEDAMCEFRKYKHSKSLMLYRS